MASTRRLEIFQDPGSTSDTAKMSSRSSCDPMNSVFSERIQHIGLPSSRDVVFKPPISRANGRSPLKTLQQPSSSPPKALYDDHVNISIPPPQASIFTTDSPLKKPTSSVFHPIAPFKPLPPIFTTFKSNTSADKENTNPTYHSDNFAEFPDPSYGYKVPLKRALSNAAPLHDNQAKKARPEEPSGPDIPEPQNMPPVEDDGRKPQYSYAALIGMSILRAPGRRLTLAQIYKWISDSFTYYRASQTGWQNSIRHNLSLNKAFIKQERPKDDPGKGNYWAIEPGMESQFIKDKASRRPTSSSGTIIKSSSLLSSEASISSTQSQPPPRAVQRVTEATEISSDATIPASDAPSQEDNEIEEVVNMPPPASRLPLSSPLQPIHSSPPLPRPSLLRENTPSPIADFALPSSSSRSRKRKLAAMDDSGYFSSLDSSAKRPFANPVLPDLTADRPRIKRGRAEEEIARIRSSSHDISPSKGRAPLKQPRSLVSSSPLRNFDSTLMLPPLTPAVRFNLPAKPPASVSPNTNLRNHRNKIRELVGSPVKNTSLSHEVSFSPAFNIVDEEHYLFSDHFDTSFDIFRDEEHDYRRPSSSPARRSARRSRTDRASRSATVLADVTGTILNSRGLLSNVKAPALESPLGQKSSKNPLVWDSNLENVPKEDLFGLEYDDEEPDDFGGVDILQGFQKIGGANHAVPSAKRLSRPNIGARSHIGPSRF